MAEAVAALPRVHAGDRMTAVVYLVAGWTLIYLVMFDQGTLLDLVVGGRADGLVFHELFHDGRHLAGVPCD
jgi:hypothetical protein